MGSSFSLTSGTQVLTIRGPINVGSLTPEDHVILQTGNTAKVSRISEEFSYENSACNEADMPILIKAYGVLDGVPVRDLLALPTQVIFINGCLISADTLINGLTVRRVKTSSIPYRDIELCVSGFVYAEGLPVGSHNANYSKINNKQWLEATQISLRKRAANTDLPGSQRLGGKAEDFLAK